MKLYSGHQVFLTGLLCAAAGAALAYYTVSISSGDNKKTSVQAKAEDYLTENESFPLTNAVSQIPVSDTSGYTKDELQNILVYEKCNEAVVNITTQTMGYNWFYEPVITSSGSGSGSIIDVRGYVVTNYHVIKNASTITISLADGTSYDGRIIGQDKESDIAVLKFDPDESIELKTIAFGENSGLKVGQKVIAIGNPFALERTMTTGIISGLGRPIQEDDVIIRNMIQTDAAINPGNSGGPLLDSSGNMIGINTVIYSSSGSSSGVGFAVPVSTAKRVVNDLIKYGKVNRGTIKVSLVQNTGRIAVHAKSRISTGMIVSKVAENSMAEAAGLKGGTQAVRYGSTFNYQTIYLGGDIITSIDNITVTKLADYYSALEDKVPGDKVKVTVWRNNESKVLTVTLEEE